MLLNTKLLTCLGRIYSVVDRVLRLELFANDDLLESVNDLMVKNGYADRCEETCISKQDHKIRLNYQKVEYNFPENTYNSDQVYTLTYDDFSKICEDLSYSTDKIQIKGPNSPIEASFAGMSNLTKKQIAVVEFESVNSIVLEPDYNIPSRLLVAGSVQMSQQGKSRVVI